MMFRISLRSAFRNRRRTLLSITLIVLGTAILFSLGGFVSFINGSVRNAIVQYVGGLQIGDEGFWSKTAPPREYLITPAERSNVEALLATIPQVTSVSGQIEIQAQMKFGRASQIVFGLGIEPERSTFSSYRVLRGRDLGPEDTKSLLVGHLLAEAYGMEIGDTITLLATTARGAFNTIRLQIIGTMRMPTETDEAFTVLFTQATARDLLRTSGIDKLVVALTNLEAADTVAELLRERLPLIREDLALKRWDELSPEFHQTRKLFRFILGAVGTAIGLLVFFVILEVLTMSFLERTREFGTTRAIGTQRGQIFRQLLMEAALFALLGAGLGVCLGYGLTAIMNGANILWRIPGEIDPTAIRIMPRLSHAILPSLIALCSTLLSAWFPAVSVTRKPIVDALRTT